MPERRHGARLGFGLLAACSVVVLCTVWFLPAPDAKRSVAAALSGGAIIGALVLLRLPWERLPARALLAFPALGLSTMTATALLTKGISPAYSGFFTVGFVYLGLTQSRRTTLTMVPVVIAPWIACVGGATTIVAAKLPVAIGIWALIGHHLATRTARSETRTGELLLAAATDPLTGLSSRRELARLLQGLDAGDAVVLLDIDHFKRVNDELGHRAGDLVLAAFGHAVRTALRTGDLALRYGGDEVLAVLPGAGGGGGEAMLERLRSQWASFPYPTFSAGVAVHDHHRSSQQTMDRADEALYTAKRAGRGRWQLHDDIESTTLTAGAGSAGPS